MDVVGSEIGQKMRSAIKAKLTELGCYVDDELPDYVMVMVANKRTRSQMEDDLQLFLGDNTELFVNWLHQVLKKLQEVTVTTPIKTAERDLSKDRSDSKERKTKEKKSKDKQKKSEQKKAKKKGKEKLSRRKDDKKNHRLKKKSKHHDMIRPNIPPLLMNMEKDSEPSITDVFAGQILKNHGITLEAIQEETRPEKKPVVADIKRPILPVIDPATILTQPEPEIEEEMVAEEFITTNVSSTGDPKEDQMKEMTEIEAKIQGLKQKLAEQLDSMSDDEDFLNIRTEAEELMNDFAEDVFQEISQQAPQVPVTVTPPIERAKSPIPPPSPPKTIEAPKDPPKEPIETLPQIELKLPKRPIRDRLGIREEPKIGPEVKEKESKTRTDSPERFTPEREPDFWPQSKSARSRLGGPPVASKRSSGDTVNDISEPAPKKLTSKVSVLENRSGRSTCASVVRVRPRPRVATPANSLLLRAVADAHKSLLNAPPNRTEPEPQIKRALVLPMRRCVDASKIIIQVPMDNSHETDRGDTLSLGDIDSDDDKSSKVASDIERDEYIPASITKKIINNEYTPSRRNEHRTASRIDDKLIIETINIHTPSVDKDKNTQFIVTMDGYHPNAFLAKKLLTEGLLTEEQDLKTSTTEPEKPKTLEIKEPTPPKEIPVEKEIIPEPSLTKRLSNTSEESETQVIIKKGDEKAEKRKNKEEEKIEKRIIKEEEKAEKRYNKEGEKAEKRYNKEEEKRKLKEEEKAEKRKNKEDEKAEKRKNTEVLKVDVPPAKKRRASPIVFDVHKNKKKDEKEPERVRERTESASSDQHVTVATITNTHKYDSVPPLSAAERKLVWCRAFPLCRYGNSCAFSHPRCKFAASCTRRNCVYSHAPNALAPPTTPTSPVISSHVVPAANYKTISTVVPNMCKFYPNCVNPLCHFYHPKPCRYGKTCVNKIECNFYHADVAAKWR